MSDHGKSFLAKSQLGAHAVGNGIVVVEFGVALRNLKLLARLSVATDLADLPLPTTGEICISRAPESLSVEEKGLEPLVYEDDDKHEDDGPDIGAPDLCIGPLVNPRRKRIASLTVRIEYRVAENSMRFKRLSDERDWMSEVLSSDVTELREPSCWATHVALVRRAEV